MLVAVTLLAGIGVASLSWSPGQVMVEILTLFTVQTFGVVITHAVTVNHALPGLAGSLNGGALRGVSIAEAVSSDHHVVDSVVILLFDLHTRVQQVVSERVQFGELHS